MKSEDDELPLGELYECRPPEARLGDDVDGVPSCAEGHESILRGLCHADYARSDSSSIGKKCPGRGEQAFLVISMIVLVAGYILSMAVLISTRSVQNNTRQRVGSRMAGNAMAMLVASMSVTDLSKVTPDIFQSVIFDPAKMFVDGLQTIINTNCLFQSDSNYDSLAKVQSETTLIFMPSLWGAMALFYLLWRTTGEDMKKG